MCKVLVLDDDPYYNQIVCDTLRQVQEPHTYRVFSCLDAEQALGEARQAGQAGAPFEIFVIDQRLKHGQDGIDVLRQLLNISPDSDGIILTGYDSLDEDGVRAYEAGAYRYLLKTAEKRELLFVLRSLQQWRQVQREHNWQKAMIQMADATLHYNTFQAVAQSVIEITLSLGFDHGQLFWVPKAEDAWDPNCLVNIIAAGDGANTSDQSRTFSIRNLYPFSEALELHTVSFYHGSSNPFDERLELVGFKPPSGSWAILPLWSTKELLGALVLSWQAGKIALRQFERSQINLFAEQIAGILDRARIDDYERRSIVEMDIIKEIGRHINLRAAVANLTDLLDEVRTYASQLLDVSNFIIVLADRDSKLLDFRLQYEGGMRTDRHKRPLNEGLAGYLLGQKEEVFFPCNVQERREDLGIPLYGHQAQCWLGVPLRVEDQTIGGIIVQDYGRPYAYTNRDRRLLVSIAEQVAGAIQVSRLAEAERVEAKRLQVLQRASAEMLRLINESEDLFWLAVLTMATADFGTRFNRALLFLASDDSGRLVGKSGVGTEDSTEAHQDWEENEARGMDFDLFLQEVQAGKIRHTPFESAVKLVEIPLHNASHAFAEVLQNRQRLIIPAEQVVSRLPEEFTRSFSFSTCAVLPLMGGNKPLGVLIVDNKHDGKNIEIRVLDQLGTLLNTAGLVWESFQQNRQRDLLIHANYAILSETGHVTLRETLERICAAARAIMATDWTIIYPLSWGGDLYAFDVPNISYAGELTAPIREVIKDKLRQKGVSAHVLRSGKLIVGDVNSEEATIGHNRLAEHSFIKREKVRALIGIAIRDIFTSESLGVLFLDYRTPRSFSPADIQQADAFANLAAVAITTSRRLREARISAGVSRQREQTVVNSMLEAALAADTRLKVIESLVSGFHRASSLFEIHTEFINCSWESQSPEREPHAVFRSYSLSEKGTLSDRLLSGVEARNANLTAQTKRIRYARDKCAAYIPVKLAESVLGLLYADQGQTTLAEEHIQMLQRLAAIGALALDNICRQEHLHSVLQVAQKVTEPTDLRPTFQALGDSLWSVSPELSSFTLWYKPAKSDLQGKLFEVYEKHKGSQAGRPEERQWAAEQVMQAAAPIFAEDVEKDGLPYFNGIWNIRSGAAFPLKANNEQVGALFFYYRDHHYFSPEERTLFTLLAEIVASSIRDAIQLEATTVERDRLEVVLDTSETIGTELDLDKIFVQVLEGLRPVFYETTLCVLIYDEYERALKFAPKTLAFYEIDNPDFSGQHIFYVDGPSVACRVARESIETKRWAWSNVPDVSQDQDYLPLLCNTRSELCVSLMSKESLLGVLVLERAQPYGFTQDDVMLIHGIAQQISLAMERGEQSEELQFKSTVAAAYAWAADIAHDMNREMGHIKSWAYLIEETSSNPDIAEFARMITKSTRYLSSIGPWKNPSLVSVKLDETIQESVMEFVSLRQILVEFDLHCAGIEAQMDVNSLKRVLLQLVRNADEAMAHQVDKKLLVHTRPAEQDWVEIYFTDFGPGVPEDVRPCVLHKPVSTKATDRGYGLLITRQMVDDMGGRIRLLEQGPGVGATFLIRLPITPAIGRTAASVAAAEA